MYLHLAQEATLLTPNEKKVVYVCFYVCMCLYKSVCTVVHSVDEAEKFL